MNASATPWVVARSPDSATHKEAVRSPITSVTLLMRLRSEVPDQQAWAEFVRRYGPSLYRWCRRWSLQQADAEDVTQMVLVKLARRMREFTYNPAQSFRAYLKSLVSYAWRDWLEQYHHPGAGSGDSQVLQALHSTEARVDLLERLQGQFDQEVLEEAVRRVADRVEVRTWEAFRLTALEGLSGAEAAGQLGMQIPTVFKAKSKVQRMLREEIQLLDPG